MAWTTLNTPVTWNMTDLDAIKLVEYRLLENGDADADGTTFATSMFTITQAIDFLNTRQRQFLKETGLITVRASQVTIAGQSRYALPTDWLDTRRLAWQQAGGNIYSLHSVDTYQLDTGMFDWESDQALPIAYQESTLPTLTTELLKAPSDVGTAYLLYTALSTTLTGAGMSFSVPDEWVPYVIWGTLGDLLSGDGESPDPQRSAYCEQRYQMGVELAKLLIQSVTGVM